MLSIGSILIFTIVFGDTPKTVIVLRPILFGLVLFYSFHIAWAHCCRLFHEMVFPSRFLLLKHLVVEHQEVCVEDIVFVYSLVAGAGFYIVLHTVV